MNEGPRGRDMDRAVNPREKIEQLTAEWEPKVIAAVNDYHIKVARIHGAFIWHSHPETDEAFLVVDGRLRIELRDGSVELGPGDLYVVPQGVEHRPVADAPCGIVMFEPAGTVNTGDQGGERTRPADDWI